MGHRRMLGRLQDGCSGSKIGNGVLFDATQQAIDSPPGTGLPYIDTDACSIYIKVRIDGGGFSAFGGPVLYMSNAFNTASQYSYYIKYTTSGALQFMASAFNQEGGRQSNTGVFSYGDTLNLCFVKRAGTGLLSEFEIYSNGVRVDASNLGTQRPSNSAPAKFCRLGSFGNFRTMEGILYDVMHCQGYEFTSQDITDLSNGIIPPVSITERWPLDENNGIIAPSHTGTRDGTLNSNFINTGCGEGTWRDENGNIPS